MSYTPQKHFISDLHLFHEKCIGFDNRPFTDIDHMHTVIRENWNDTVHPGDVVYIIGDVSFGTLDQTVRYLSTLNGSLHLIAGNHDRNLVTHKNALLSRNIFASIAHYRIISLKDKRQVHMHHCPLECWPRQARGAAMLYGHCHGGLREYGPPMLRWDVGIMTELVNYRPLSEDRLIALINEREALIREDNYNCRDHH